MEEIDDPEVALIVREFLADFSGVSTSLVEAGTATVEEAARQHDPDDLERAIDEVIERLDREIPEMDALLSQLRTTRLAVG